MVPGNLIISVAYGGGQTEDISIMLPGSVRITLGENAARRGDFRIGQTVDVTYETQSVASITKNAPTGEKKVLRFADASRFKSSNDR